MYVCVRMCKCYVHPLNRQLQPHLDTYHHNIGLCDYKNYAILFFFHMDYCRVSYFVNLSKPNNCFFMHSCLLVVIHDHEHLLYINK